jgi:hypothetical protein
MFRAVRPQGGPAGDLPLGIDLSPFKQRFLILRQSLVACPTLQKGTGQVL